MFDFTATDGEDVFHIATGATPAIARGNAAYKATESVNSGNWPHEKRTIITEAQVVNFYRSLGFKVLVVPC